MRSNVFPALIAIASLLITWSARSDSISVTSIEQQAPGVVSLVVELPDDSMPQASDFRLRFDDKRIVRANEAEPFEAVAPDTVAVLCVDRSGSMGHDWHNLREVLLTVFERPHPHLKIALIAFGSRTETLQEFTDDTRQLIPKIAALRSEGAEGQTKLYEAAFGALDQLKSRQNTGPKRLIIISDSKDEGSAVAPQRIIDKAKANAIPIDTIGFGRLAERSASSLEILSANTGGHFELAKTQTEDLIHALDQVLQPAKPRRSIKVAFKYKPSADKRTVDAATIELIRTDQPVLQEAIRANLALPGVPEEAPPVTAPPPVTALPPHEDTGSKKYDFHFNVSFSWVKEFLIRYELQAIAGVLGALLLIVFYTIMKQWFKSPPPPPPPPQPPIFNTTEPTRRNRRQTVVSRYVFPQPSAGRPTAILVGLSGIATAQTYLVDKAIYKIGANAKNDLRLSADEYVSAEHAHIRYDSGSLYLFDLGSTNGTSLNGVVFRQSAVSLSPGDEIKIGRSILRVQIADGQTPEPLVDEPPVR